MAFLQQNMDIPTLETYIALSPSDYLSWAENHWADADQTSKFTISAIDDLTYMLQLNVKTRVTGGQLKLPEGMAGEMFGLSTELVSEIS